MNGRARLSIVVAVSAATCVGPGGPPSPGGLGYRVPSPPAATYRVDDSTVVRNRPLLQEREITTRTAVTLDPGTTWVDTVAWSSDAASSEIAFTHAYTYTLVGDTLVDGRSLLNISFAGEVAIESSGQAGQRESTSSSKGSATGLILWDVERGLPVYGEIEEKTEGTTIREGLPPSRISRSKLRRIRLEG